MNDVVIVGGGGFAKAVADGLRKSGFRIVGVVDRTPDAVKIKGVAVLGDDTVLMNVNPAAVLLANGIGGTGATDARRRIFDSFRQRGFRFATVLHPTAIADDDIRLEMGAQIMAGAILQQGVSVGENAIVNIGAVINHDCHIGKHAHITPGVTLSGNVTIGAGSHIGTGASIIQGITIGENCLIAAGAAVIRDVPARTRVGGVPAIPF